jgi:signal transduction histidine kinase/CheY-like chemotaxis protein
MYRCKKAWKIIISWMILCSMLCMVLPCALAADNTQARTVKVGVLNNTTYADQDENGVWRGMDVECMTKIAQQAGFKLEFIDSSNDPDFLGGLDNGTYDIVADVVKTPEREAKYAFTDQVLGNTNSTLAVRADDDRWDYGNIEQISTMKIGVLASYANNADFRQWCAGHAVTPAITEFTTIEQMTEALSQGDIDGEVYTAIYGDNSAVQLRSIMKFLPESYYFAFRKDDVQLKNQVDDALSQIFVGDANYLENLKNKYETIYGANVLPFSASEKDYIAQHALITVAVVKDDAPYYSENTDGTVDGIIPDYYALIAEQTGFTFQYISYATNDDAVKAVKSGKADLVGIFGDGQISAYQNDLILTDSFVTANNMLVTSQGTDLSKLQSIAIKKRAADSVSASISRVFPNAQIKTFESTRECFNAVDNGMADAAILALPSATWMINQTNSSTYSIVAVPGVTSNLCAAVQSGNSTLCAIMNKSIMATKGSFPGIVTEDTLPQSDWQSAISRIPPAIIILVVVILLALVVGLTWALFLLRSRERERAAVLAAQAETEKQRMQVESIQRNTEERNRFFANISHDMRTPLNAVLGFAREARKEDITPAQRDDYLSKVEVSGKLLLDLINDTLTLSKINSGKLTLQLKPCRTSELLEAVASPIRDAAEKKGIDLIIDDAHMPERIILADRLNIEKIFLNLLTNAIKYTPEGGRIWYTISETDRDDGTMDYEVTVRDDGIGIGSEFLPHIFEPFAQEKQSGYETMGTGLGLSIVKQLVDLMGGTITVESTEGVGTAFTVRLRLEEVSGDAAPQPKAAGKADWNHLPGSKVLLCEDNALNREIAGALLKEKQIAVDFAENGQVGIQKFCASGEGDYDAVLMDLRMPVMDGYTATRTIRQLDRGDAAVPIIAMTADAFADDVQKCLDAGMNDHVAKPIDPDTLNRVLAEQIGAAGRG